MKTFRLYVDNREKNTSIPVLDLEFHLKEKLPSREVWEIFLHDKETRTPLMAVGHSNPEGILLLISRVMKKLHELETVAQRLRPLHS